MLKVDQVYMHLDQHLDLVESVAIQFECERCRHLYDSGHHPDSPENSCTYNRMQTITPDLFLAEDVQEAYEKLFPGKPVASICTTPTLHGHWDVETQAAIAKEVVKVADAIHVYDHMLHNATFPEINMAGSEGESPLPVPAHKARAIHAVLPMYAANWMNIIQNFCCEKGSVGSAVLLARDVPLHASWSTSRDPRQTMSITWLKLLQRLLGEEGVYTAFPLVERVIHTHDCANAQDVAYAMSLRAWKKLTLYHSDDAVTMEVGGVVGGTLVQRVSKKVYDVVMGRSSTLALHIVDAQSHGELEDVEAQLLQQDKARAVAQVMAKGVGGAYSLLPHVYNYLVYDPDAGRLTTFVLQDVLEQVLVRFVAGKQYSMDLCIQTQVRSIAKEGREEVWYKDFGLCFGANRDIEPCHNMLMPHLNTTDFWGNMMPEGCRGGEPWMRYQNALQDTFRFQNICMCEMLGYVVMHTGHVSRDSAAPVWYNLIRLFMAFHWFTYTTEWTVLQPELEKHITQVLDEGVELLGEEAARTMSMDYWVRRLIPLLHQEDFDVADWEKYMQGPAEGAPACALLHGHPMVHGKQVTTPLRWAVDFVEDVLKHPFAWLRGYIELHKTGQTFSAAGKPAPLFTATAEYRAAPVAKGLDHITVDIAVPKPVPVPMPIPVPEPTGEGEGGGGEGGKRRTLFMAKYQGRLWSMASLNKPEFSACARIMALDLPMSVSAPVLMQETDDVHELTKAMLEPLHTTRGVSSAEGSAITGFDVPFMESPLRYDMALEVVKRVFPNFTTHLSPSRLFHLDWKHPLRAAVTFAPPGILLGKRKSKSGMLEGESAFKKTFA